jgi:hypothetical protein
MADWFRSLVPVCHVDLTGHRSLIADLGSGVPGTSCAALETKPSDRSPVASGALR